MVKAFHHYHQGAVLGCDCAQLDVGDYYYYGTGDICQDDDLAFGWYSLAVEKGSEQAQWRLGCWNEETGKGSLSEALKWHRLAAGQGHEAAQQAMDRLLMKAEDSTGSHE